MFGKEINDQILKYAKENAEIEICGYISASKEFVTVPNLSPKSATEFVVDSRLIPDDILAFIHSHPNGPFYPSEADMQQQIATDAVWGIAAFDNNYQEIFWFGEEVETPKLVGRGFRHGVTDCYSLIKDFYKQIHQIKLPEFPREWEWWDGKAKLYEDGFAQAGFREISRAEILPGDVFLASVRSETPNHAAVYLGDGLILHHTSGRVGYDPFRLSTVEPGARWFNFMTKVLRHEDDTIDRAIGQKVR